MRHFESTMSNIAGTALMAWLAAFGTVLIVASCDKPKPPEAKVVDDVTRAAQLQARLLAPSNNQALLGSVYNDLATSYPQTLTRMDDLKLKLGVADGPKGNTAFSIGNGQVLLNPMQINSTTARDLHLIINAPTGLNLKATDCYTRVERSMILRTPC